MTNDLIKIINAETGEEIERAMTDDEQAARNLDIANDAARKAAKQLDDKAQADAKATAEAKLAALGLTTDDLKALGLGNN